MQKLIDVKLPLKVDTKYILHDCDEYRDNHKCNEMYVKTMPIMKSFNFDSITTDGLGILDGFAIVGHGEHKYFREVVEETAKEKPKLRDHPHAELAVKYWTGEVDKVDIMIGDYWHLEENPYFAKGLQYREHVENPEIEIHDGHFYRGMLNGEVMVLRAPFNIELLDVFEVTKDLGDMLDD